MYCGSQAAHPDLGHIVGGAGTSAGVPGSAAIWILQGHKWSGGEYPEAHHPTQGHHLDGYINRYQCTADWPSLPDVLADQMHRLLSVQHPVPERCPLKRTRCQMKVMMKCKDHDIEADYSLKTKQI